mmetsp:Transcript_24194/g.55038  ORF Transcript_24194/g.55038 Transcript_24194/m.55038 type:complete len:273 (-) Transcript_24194:25-843(-)
MNFGRPQFQNIIVRFSRTIVSHLVNRLGARIPDFRHVRRLPLTRDDVPILELFLTRPPGRVRERQVRRRTGKGPRDRHELFPRPLEVGRRVVGLGLHRRDPLVRVAEHGDHQGARVVQAVVVLEPVLPADQLRFALHRREALVQDGRDPVGARVAFPEKTDLHDRAVGASAAGGRGGASAEGGREHSRQGRRGRQLVVYSAFHQGRGQEQQRRHGYRDDLGDGRRRYPFYEAVARPAAAGAHIGQFHFSFRIWSAISSRYFVSDRRMDGFMS